MSSATARALALASLLPCMSAAHAASDDATRLKAMIDSALPVEASFIQEVVSDDGETLQHSQGEVVLASEGRLRWEIYSPDENLLVSNGETVWIYNPFVEQVTIMNASDAVANTPALLLTSDAAQEWAGYEIKQNKGGYRVTPHDDTGMVEWLQIDFDGKQIDGLTMRDIQGNVSDIRLEPPSGPTDLSDGMFTFVPDAFTDVNDQRR